MQAQRLAFGKNHSTDRAVGLGPHDCQIELVDFDLMVARLGHRFETSGLSDWAVAFAVADFSW